jgi:hypothetical protein
LLQASLDFRELEQVDFLVTADVPGTLVQVDIQDLVVLADIRVLVAIVVDPAIQASVVIVD